MKKTVILRLKGMQSWGDSSKETYRHTRNDPTFSGVIGMIMSAMGLQISDSESQPLLSLRMAVRVNAEGSQEHDFHMATKFITMNKVNKNQSVVTHRYYLSNSDFLVAFSGEGNIIEKVAYALKFPKYHMFLGRMAFAPTTPIFVGVLDIEDPVEALKSLQVNFPLSKGMIRFVVDTQKDWNTEKVWDFPTGKNQYSSRQVTSKWILMKG